MIQAMMYRIGPPKPPRNSKEAMMKPTRSTVASTPRYWPKPPATPPMVRLVRLRRNLGRGPPALGGGAEYGGGVERGGEASTAEEVEAGAVATLGRS